METQLIRENEPGELKVRVPNNDATCRRSLDDKAASSVEGLIRLLREAEGECSASRAIGGIIRGPSPKSRAVVTGHSIIARPIYVHL